MIENFRMNIEYLRNSPILKRRSEATSTNLQSSFFNLQLLVADKATPSAGLHTAEIDIIFLVALCAVVHLHAIP